MGNNVYEVIKIDENSWRIEEDGVRCFLFAGTEKAMLVDSGYGTGDIKEIVDEITKLPVMLVNTHADGDHIGCNKSFGLAYMHPAEFDRYHHQKSTGSGFVASPLWEGDIIDLGVRKFEVVLIPGHTPGSIALLDKDNKILITGDSVQGGSMYMFGPGRNIHAYIHSMKKLEALGGFDAVYPSHGPAFPLDSGIVTELIEFAELVRDGKLTGIKPPVDVPCLLFEHGRVKMLYS